MTQFDAVRAAPPKSRITNGREILAYALAQVIKLAAIYAVSYAGLLTPVYLWALRHGGRLAIYAASTSIGVAWGLIVLALFLALRLAVDGVPTVAGASGRERPAMSTGIEIGAFVLAYGAVLIALMVLNIAVLTSVYSTLGRSRQFFLVFGVSLTVSVVSAIAVFFIFIVLRQAFGGVTASSGAGRGA